MLQKLPCATSACESAEWAPTLYSRALFIATGFTSDEHRSDGEGKRCYLLEFGVEEQQGLIPLLHNMHVPGHHLRPAARLVGFSSWLTDPTPPLEVAVQRLRERAIIPIAF